MGSAEEVEGLSWPTTDCSHELWQSKQLLYLGVVLLRYVFHSELCTNKQKYVVFPLLINSQVFIFNGHVFVKASTTSR